MVAIKKAQRGYAVQLTEIAFRSKAHWGYSEEFMQACREELSYSEADLQSPHALYFVAKHNRHIVGFYQLADLTRQAILLEALFVEPTFIGKGVGRKLITHAINQASRLGTHTLIAHSDPNAEKFYRAMGARVIGYTQSGSIEGRYLPTIEISL